MARHPRSRSRYKKLSDAVFTKTGLPLSRLLSVIIGLAVVGGLIAYALQADSKSSASALETPTSPFDSDASDEQNFLSAGTLPAEFSTLPLPVKLEKIDSMILHCQHLINQDNNYQEDIKSKLISLNALKCITLSKNDLASTSAIEALESTVTQVAATEAEREAYRYLIVFVHMSNLAYFPDAEHYNRAVSAIKLINESTPVLPAKTVGCYNSALDFYDKSDDKDAAKNLLNLLGTKMTLTKQQRFVDLGLSLMDYPVFSYYIQESSLKERSLNTTKQLTKLIRKAPPKSENTYKVLLKLPEHYLETGNAKLAAKILAELRTAAAGTDERFRTELEAKITTIAKRIALLGKPFSLTGKDIKGRPLLPTKKDKTVVIFWSPRHRTALSSLAQMRESSLYDQWTDELMVASDAELKPEVIAKLRNQFPHFRFLDFPTSMDWINKSGVSQSPYLMIVDKQGIVNRFSIP